MVYSTKRFVVCLSVCRFLVFFGPFGVAVASLGEGVGCWSWCFSYVCSVCACLDLLVSSSSWVLGRAAVCDCGTPWTFLLPFFTKKNSDQDVNILPLDVSGIKFFFFFFFFFLTLRNMSSDIAVGVIYAV